MNEPGAEYHLETEGSYQFLCSRCWTPQTITLAPHMPAPTCRCGSVLSVIAQFTGRADRVAKAARRVAKANGSPR